MKVLTFTIILLGLFAGVFADSIPPGKITIETIEPGRDSVNKSEPVTYHVYYFHSTRRCASCLKIENYTRATVDENFKTQLEDSSLVWHMINTDEEDNKHFLKDYQLFTKSVVLTKVIGSKEIEWKNLDKVWDLLGDEAKFKSYIADELTEFCK